MLFRINNEKTAVLRWLKFFDIIFRRSTIMNIEFTGDFYFDFCRMSIEIETFKQDLLDRIENKLRSGSNMPNYYENNLQEFDHKRSIYESVAQLPSAENTDKVIRYETHLQRSIEKNLRLLRSLQGFGQMSFGFVW